VKERTCIVNIENKGRYLVSACDPSEAVYRALVYANCQSASKVTVEVKGVYPTVFSEVLIDRQGVMHYAHVAYEIDFR
jgi:hypothetical protein